MNRRLMGPSEYVFCLSAGAVGVQRERATRAVRVAGRVRVRAGGGRRALAAPRRAARAPRAPRFPPRRRTAAAPSSPPSPAALTRARRRAAGHRLTTHCAQGPHLASHPPSLDIHIVETHLRLGHTILKTSVLNSESAACQ